MLSDHVLHFFGRTITLTDKEQLAAIVIVVIAVTAWAVQQFRHRRSVAIQRSMVSDQVVYELSRIADALDRIANRPVDEAMAAVGQPDNSRAMPFSMFGRER